MGKYLILIAILALCSANQHKNEKPEKHRKSYVCPPNFMRLSNKCYYFSNRTSTWQDAYWKCRDMHSNIATIKNSNQDKILRRTLDHDNLVPLERWVGGRYDWGTMSWKWAASGKPVQYQGFGDRQEVENKESLIWHCIILDPTKHYRWSSRRCTDEKHFVCQTKIRIVNNKDKKKLQKHYSNKLNEVPVPDIRTNHLGGNQTHYAKHKFHDNNVLSNEAFAHRPKENRIRLKKKKDTIMYKTINGTVQELPKQEKRKRNGYRTRRNKHHNGGKGKNHTMDKIKWRTYYEATKSPQHPRVAVEEFNYR